MGFDVLINAFEIYLEKDKNAKLIIAGSDDGMGNQLEQQILELKLNKEKLPFVRKTLITAIVPLIITAFVIAFAFSYFLEIEFQTQYYYSIASQFFQSSLLQNLLG